LFAAPHWYDMITRVVVMMPNCNRNINVLHSAVRGAQSSLLIVVKLPNTNDTHTRTHTHTQTFAVWIKRHVLHSKFAVESASHSNGPHVSLWCGMTYEYCLQQTEHSANRSRKVQNTGPAIRVMVCNTNERIKHLEWKRKPHNNTQPNHVTTRSQTT
jgi:hypothetical protein